MKSKKKLNARKVTKASVTEPNLVLIRHGESTWNKKGVFTGWIDVGLSAKGKQEARQAGQLIRGYTFDKAYTSVLKRAVKTLEVVLQEAVKKNVSVVKNWHLNERHYGALQGKSKKAIAKEYGEKQFWAWRRSFKERPPRATAVELKGQIRISGVTTSNLPRSESLYDTYKRVLPYWKKEILPAILKGKSVLIVAHGNSLRALVKHLEKISDRMIPQLEIPTGQPWCYQISKAGKVNKKWILKKK